MAALYAATYPERTRALVLFHPMARGSGIDGREAQEELRELRDEWGVQEWCDELLRTGCPTLYENEDDRRWFANWLRVGASPAVAYALNRAFYETDLRDVLPAVRVPTLVLYRQAPHDTENEALNVASRIPNARAMRVSGHDYFGIFLSLDIADEIERFVAGEEAPAIPTSVLTTVMFTDLVGSTRQATRWATAPGEISWPRTMASSAGSWRASAARSATPPETASSPPSTARRAPSARPGPSCQGCMTSGSTPESGFTSASASSTMPSRQGSRSASGHALPQRPGRVRSWSRAPCEISSRDPGSGSTSEALRRSRACQGFGSCSRSSRRPTRPRPQA
jgi:hypothetical protein